MNKVFCKPTQAQLKTVKDSLEYYSQRCIKDMRYLYYDPESNALQANAMSAPMGYTEVTFDEFTTINF